MFVCGYHFPADMGNDVSFDKVIEKVEEIYKKSFSKSQ